MAYDRLSEADAAFLHIESDHEPQHVGSLSLIEGAPLRDRSGRLRIEELRGVIENRLHRVPRLRQRLVFVPLAQGAPVWVDDEGFDIGYHVRLTALPQPGDDEQLDELMGRLQSVPLDRGRPLWELWFIDGVAGDRVGLAIKSHHALGDGIANVDLALALVDLERDPPPDEAAPRWRPRPPPSSGRLMVDSAAEMLAEPVRLARSGLRAVRDPQRALTAVGDTLGAAVGFASRPVPAPWNTAVTPHRRWARATVPLSVVRAIRARHDATINDVVLGACSGALREYLVDHDDADRVAPLKAMVPVSRRAEDEHAATMGNKVSLIVVDLPVGEEDPIVSLAHIHDQTSELKGSGLADGAEHIVDLFGHVPVVAAPMARLLSRSIPMNLVITNIPGPPTPLFVRGGRVLEAYPYVEVIDGEGLTIAVVSYDDALHFGLTADRDVMPDLQLLAEGIEKAMTRLTDAMPAEAATMVDSAE
jgi:WS/DGAT/MGAT family acyltransferase